MTLKSFRAYLERKYLGVKEKKYKNKPAQGFPSALERDVYGILLLREKAGEITDIQRQQSVEIAPRIRWRLDFSYRDCQTSDTVYVEAKGVETEVYRMKLKLWENGERKHTLEIWKAGHNGPALVRTIPKR